MFKTLIYTILCLFSLAAFMLVVPAHAANSENNDSSKTFGSFTESQRYIDTAGSSFYAGISSRNTIKIVPEYGSSSALLDEISSGFSPDIVEYRNFSFTTIAGTVIAFELLDLPPPFFSV